MQGSQGEEGKDGIGKERREKGRENAKVSHSWAHFPRSWTLPFFILFFPGRVIFPPDVPVCEELSNNSRGCSASEEDCCTFLEAIPSRSYCTGDEWDSIY